jgi:hypothetical protein
VPCTTALRDRKTLKRCAEPCGPDHGWRTRPQEMMQIIHGSPLHQLLLPNVRHWASQVP